MHPPCPRGDPGRRAVPLCKFRVPRHAPTVGSWFGPGSTNALVSWHQSRRITSQSVAFAAAYSVVVVSLSAAGTGWTDDVSRCFSRSVSQQRFRGEQSSSLRSFRLGLANDCGWILSSRNPIKRMCRTCSESVHSRNSNLATTSGRTQTHSPHLVRRDSLRHCPRLVSGRFREGAAIDNEALKALVPARRKRERIPRTRAT